MKTYRIILSGAYSGSATLKATAPDVAVKKVLGGGAQANYKYASVNAQYRVNLKKGETLTVQISRVD